MPTAKELREKRAPLAVRIKELADVAHGEKGWSAEDRANWEAVNADYNAATEQITISERAEAVDAEQRTRTDERPIGREDTSRQRNVDQPDAREIEQRSFRAWAQYQMGIEPAAEDQEFARQAGVYVGAHEFEFRLRRTGAPTLGRELRAQSVATDTAGGYLVPEGFIQRLERALLAFGGVMGVAEILRTANGNPLRWPTTNDTSNTGERLGENTAVAEQDIAVGQYTFGAQKYSSKLILVSHELLRDSAFDLAGLVGSMAGERLARRANTDFTTGSGAAGVPQGIVTGSTAGNTTASGTAITADEIINLVHQIDPAYRTDGCGFMMHDGILLYVRKLKDGNGQYLWQPSNQMGVADRLFGYPLTINQDMQATVATATKTMLFGQFRNYKIREVAGVRVRRLMERYAEKDQEGFVAFMEWDAALINAGTNPVKHLLQA